jgi:hypothetical protein
MYHISESFGINVLGVVDPDLGWKNPDPGWKNPDLGSGINIRIRSTRKNHLF